MDLQELIALIRSLPEMLADESEPGRREALQVLAQVRTHAQALSPPELLELQEALRSQTKRVEDQRELLREDIHSLHKDGRQVLGYAGLRSHRQGQRLWLKV